MKTKITAFLGLLIACLMNVSCGAANGVQEKPDSAKSADQQTKLQTDKQEDQKSAQDKKLENRKLIAKLGPESSTDFSNGKFQEALTKAKKICELEPDVLQYQFFRGNVGFAAGDMTQSVEAFDEVIRLDRSSEPQLWQRGLALYYANRFADGVKQFETHQTVNSQDVENAVWHLLCAARVSDVEKARKKLIPITGDTRVPMSQVYEMFAGRMTPEEVVKAANQTSTMVPEGGMRHRLQQYYAHLYIGLYHEMLKKPVDAQSALQKAVKVNPLEKDNFMGVVADVHLRTRAAEAKEKRATPASDNPDEKQSSIEKPSAGK